MPGSGMVRWPSCRWDLLGGFYGSLDETSVKPVTGAATLIVASRSEPSAGAPAPHPHGRDDGGEQRPELAPHDDAPDPSAVHVHPGPL
jgi:hypothetical protein